MDTRWQWRTSSRFKRKFNWDQYSDIYSDRLALLLIYFILAFMALFTSTAHRQGLGVYFLLKWIVERAMLIVRRYYFTMTSLNNLMRLKSLTWFSKKCFLLRYNFVESNLLLMTILQKQGHFTASQPPRPKFRLQCYKNHLH